MKFTSKRIPLQCGYTSEAWTRNKGDAVYHVEAHMALCGLAYHECFAEKHKGQWNITHVASGISIGPVLPSEQAARRALEAIAPLLDWKQSGDKIKPQVRAMMERIKQAYADACIVQGTLFEEGSSE